jgi:hypothetical protein
MAGRIPICHTDPSSAAEPGRPAQDDKAGGGGGQRDKLHARSQKPRPYPFLRQGKRNGAGYTGPTRGG